MLGQPICLVCLQPSNRSILISSVRLPDFHPSPPPLLCASFHSDALTPPLSCIITPLVTSKNSSSSSSVPEFTLLLPVSDSLAISKRIHGLFFLPSSSPFFLSSETESIQA
ncbi:hypothetical protein Dimus_021232 [Dionaea muscipula]